MPHRVRTSWNQMCHTPTDSQEFAYIAGLLTPLHRTPPDLKTGGGNGEPGISASYPQPELCRVTLSDVVLHTVKGLILLSHSCLGKF